jgi:hypothetical protein
LGIRGIDAALAESIESVERVFGFLAGRVTAIYEFDSRGYALTHGDAMYEPSRTNK